jgi:hypothetical protein
MGMYLYGITQVVIGKFKGEPVYLGKYIGKPYTSWDREALNNRMYGRARACQTRFERKGITPKYFSLDKEMDEIYESKHGGAWFEDHDLDDPNLFPRMEQEVGVCNSCDFEGSGFRARIGSDLHFDGAPIDADAPLSGWLECPECQHLSCS